jgi:hypothetical protein
MVAEYLTQQIAEKQAREQQKPIFLFFVTFVIFVAFVVNQET